MLDERLETLSKLPAKRSDWGKVAAIVADLADDHDWQKRFSSKAAMWEDLGGRIGSNQNMASRLAQTYRGVCAIEAKHQDELRDVLKPNAGRLVSLAEALSSFGKAELIVRTYKKDPNIGLDLVRKVVLGGMPVSQLKDEYNDLVNSLAPGRRRRFKTVSQAVQEKSQISQLEENASLIYGGDEARFYYGRYHFRLVSVDAVALSWRDMKISFVDGFVLAAPISQDKNREYQNLLSATDYQASFFRHLWLYFPMMIDGFADRLGDDLNRLGLATVGILVETEPGEIKAVRRPKAGEPPARYQTVLQEIMRQGIPDFGAE